VDEIKKLILCQALHQGPSYLVDKKWVYQVIRDAVSGTDGWTWIQDIKNKHSRLEIKCLQDHYDGPGPKTHCVQDIKERLKVCVYKSEITYSFEQYVSILKECFATLEDNERAITKWDKLDYYSTVFKNMVLAMAMSMISMLQTLQSLFEEALGILQSTAIILAHGQLW